MIHKKVSVDTSTVDRDYKSFIVDPVDISFGKLCILANTKLVIQYGHNYGLVGKNGIGKTSLLDAIAHKTINVPPRLDLIYVKQAEPETDMSVFETLLSTNKEIYNRHKRVTELEQQINEVDVSVDMIDEYNTLSELLGSDYIKSKISAQKILLGLGFTKEQQLQPVSIFSGGWRMRISLAKALFMIPTLLILDEPTNHLDLHANLWLTNYLKSYKKTILVVSHDKYFIDEVCTTIININNHQLCYYKGNYEQFQKQLTLDLGKHQKDWNLYQKRLQEMKRSHKSPADIEAFVLKQKLSKPEKEYTVKLKFLQPNLIRGHFFSMENINFSYENQPLTPTLTNQSLTLTNLSLSLGPSDRIAIVGKNGIGKTTLLKLITSELKYLSGEINKSGNLRIGYYNQHFDQTMPIDIDPVEYLHSLNAELDLTSIHKYLSMFGLEPNHHNRKINLLSGGQKSRVKFASFGVMMPHLLVLDEPTNHLDIVTIESLINALNDFEGAIVIVTHNFDIISRIHAKLYIMDENGLHQYMDTYENYVQDILNNIDEDTVD